MYRVVDGEVREEELRSYMYKDLVIIRLQTLERNRLGIRW